MKITLTKRGFSISLLEKAKLSWVKLTPNPMNNAHRVFHKAFALQFELCDFAQKHPEFIPAVKSGADLVIALRDVCEKGLSK